MEFECEFKICEFSGFYTCNVLSGHVKSLTDLKALKGEHEDNKTNEEVKCFLVDRSILYTIPRAISALIPNLVNLTLDNCKLKEIKAEDLEGLANLEVLLIIGNDLRLLPDDLLVNNTKLRQMIFDDNKIEFMSSHLFDYISDEQIEMVSFEKNTKINAWFPSGGKTNAIKSVQDLKALIDASCIPPLRFPIKTQESFTNAWELKTGDFTFVVDSKEVFAWKNVLAVQSSVFRSIFEKDEAKNKLEIKDCTMEVFETFLLSLYTGEILNGNYALELFSLACTYDVDDLKETYKNIAIQNVNDLNALHALNVGNCFDSENLIDAAFNQIKKMHPKDIILDKLKRNEEHLLEILATVEEREACLKRCNDKIKKLNTLESW